MTLEELVLPHDYDTITSDKNYIKRCLCHPNLDRRSPEYDEYFIFMNTTLANSSSSDDFIDNFLADKRFIKTTGYIELMMRERPDKVWYYVRENFGDRCFKTESDIGSVKVGTDDFSVAISNGYGDGVTRVAVFNNADEFYSGSVMHFHSSIEGHFFIYDYDCGGGEPVKELSGRYGVYYYSGLVAFVYWGK